MKLLAFVLLAINLLPSAFATGQTFQVTVREDGTFFPRNIAANPGDVVHFKLFVPFFVPYASRLLISGIDMEITL